MEEEIISKMQRWYCFFIIKVCIATYAAFHVLLSYSFNDYPQAGLALILFVIIGIWVYYDVKTDPYGILKIYWLLFRQRYLSKENQVTNVQDDDLPTPITVKFTKKELKNGTTKVVKLQFPQLCPECSNVSISEECSLCKGAGFHQDPSIELSIFGNSPSQVCYQCNGTGQVFSNPCKHTSCFRYGSSNFGHCQPR